MTEWSTITTSMKQILLCVCLAAGCLPLAVLPVHSQFSRSIHMQPFGKTSDGEEVSLYALRNSSGMEATITNYGGTITSLKVMDRKKRFADVVLGFDDLAGYISTANNAYFGATIGRYANRIAKGTFTLDNQTYHTPINDGPNTLHGGLKGFDKRVWQAEEVATPEGHALELHYVSHDGEEGFPGNLDVTVRYSLGEKNDLRIDYRARTDKDTVLNLTNHSYFNLAGAGEGDILHHKLTITADRFTPIDSTLIPTGDLQPVTSTPFDFRSATDVGARINRDNQQLHFAHGYDHNFVLNHPAGNIGLAARVEEPHSGRVMEVYTDQPGVQFYTGNFLNGKIHGKGGKAYEYRSALCLETQHFPDSPNHPNFPTSELKAGKEFHSSTIYRFSVE